MAEQTFRSPGFFEQEIDLSSRIVSPTGTPGGVIGTADRGPAFVPVTIGSFADFQTKFGTLDPDRFGPYAVKEFLKYKTSLTYMRVLGAGANQTATDISNTQTKGTVKNAGFVITGTKGNGPASMNQGRWKGATQMIVARHVPPATEAAGFPVFTDNNSFFVDRDADTEEVDLVRGVVLLATGTQLLILSNDESATNATLQDDGAKVGAITGTPLDATKYFKLVLSSSAGKGYGNDDGIGGLRVLTCSLDPSNGNYISKVLNTDPLKFEDEEHLLYLDFSVEDELAAVKSDANQNTVTLVSGSVFNKSDTSGDTSLDFLSLFGKYDTRYTTPKTTDFISQPYGNKEYDLFHFETLSDGEYANDKFKVSIANLRASTDPRNKFGTFEVQVRGFSDTDTNMEILERYPECNLNPNSDRYVARQIGDKKVYYDFDQEDPDERRLVILGKYPNVSKRVRIRMNVNVEEKEVPQDAMPFGFRGLPVLKTSDTLTDSAHLALTGANGVLVGGGEARRLNAVGVGVGNYGSTGSIVPPLPYRFKVTRGQIDESTSPGFVGLPGRNERVDGRFYWGVKTTIMPVSSSNGGDAVESILNTNVSSLPNPLIKAYTKYQGIELLDALVTGSGRDEFNNNKFTLARVAFSNKTTDNVFYPDLFNAMTGSSREHMLEAAYIRNGVPNSNTYVVSDGVAENRFTLASLIQTSSVLFNRFTEYAKFTNLFYGGFDGVNILDLDSFYFRDKAFSSDTGGLAVDATPNIGLSDLGTAGGNQLGKGRLNNAVASFRRAIDIMTDPLSVNINILTTPGVRDSFVTDHALTKTRTYSQAIYLMDTLKYDEDGTRLYDDSSTRVDVRETSEQFESRAIDNNYGATFFPDVYVNDDVNNQVVKVPSSVVAMGTLAFNDKVSFPWFAPAGFNRGSLASVVNVENRLTSGDRDTLYDARINPIAVFPRTGFVIFGQKTMQMAKSALDRINVRRLLLEVKRQVVRVADKILFEPNTAQTRARFVSQVTPLLALIQAQAGIEQFKVVMDETNNTVADVEANRLNGRIVVVPTRAVEFIAVDFIVTNSGVSFE